MVSAIDSALSGLASASKRIEVSANNIANQSSPDAAQKVDQVSLSQGGVQALASQSSDSTDTAKELVNQNVASYDFKANLKTITTQQAVEKSLLDIIS